eukprot:scaffold3627_cov124-Isochrysis_galbana.AAC.2
MCTPQPGAPVAVAKTGNMFDWYLATNNRGKPQLGRWAFYWEEGTMANAALAKCHDKKLALASWLTSQDGENSMGKRAAEHEATKGACTTNDRVESAPPAPPGNHASARPPPF